MSILDAFNVVNLYTSLYFKVCSTSMSTICGLKRSCEFEKCHAKVLCNWKLWQHLKSVTQRFYVTENFNIRKLNCQLFVFILTWSTVVNLYTLKYVALQDINCGVRYFEKCHELYNWKSLTWKTSTESTVNYLYSYWMHQTL